MELAVRDQIEPVFEIRGEIVFHITLEEGFKEGRDQGPYPRAPAASFRASHIRAREAPTWCSHRSTGGRCPPLHLADQRGFGEARRRLGEMLRGRDARVAQFLAAVELGQPGEILVLGVVAAFLVKLEEAVEHHHRAVARRP